MDDKGFSMKNVGTGKYLKDNSPAKYDTPTFFSFCTLKATADIAAVKTVVPVVSAIYTLDGRLVSGHHLKKGIYIKEGKKFVVR